MASALWFLMRLRLGGWVRQIGRSLRTLKGVLVSVLGTLLLIAWLLPAVLLAPPPTPEHLQTVQDLGPTLLLLFTLLNLVSTAGQRAISFSPAEVNLLFPAPFSRRALVIYKLVITFAGALLGAVFFALILRMHFSGYLTGVVAMTLLILFMQLFSIALALIAEWVGAQVYNRRRWWVVFGLLALIAVILLPQGGALVGRPWAEVVREVTQTPVFWVLLAPFRWLIATATAPDLGSLALNGLLALGTNLALLTIVLFLDQRYLEAAASASEQVYKQIEQMRRGGAGAVKMSLAGKASFSLPSLPHWGGVGPLLWRHLTGAVRSPWWLLIIVIFSAVTLVPVILGSAETHQHSPGVAPILIMVVFMMALMVPPLLPFDFRGDLDRMDMLKMLPLPNWRIVLGQILAPVLLVTLLQYVLVGVLLSVAEPEASILAIIPFLPSLNLFLFAIENVFFLWFPTRLVAAGPGDFQTLGRHMLLWLVKFVSMLVVLGSAFGLGVLTALLCGDSWVAGGLIAWVVLTLAAVGLLPLVALAFQNFDVSRDLPA